MPEPETKTTAAGMSSHDRRLAADFLENIGRAYGAALGARARLFLVYGDPESDNHYILATDGDGGFTIASGTDTREAAKLLDDFLNADAAAKKMMK
jgi:hypothetical protein